MHNLVLPSTLLILPEEFAESICDRKKTSQRVYQIKMPIFMVARTPRADDVASVFPVLFNDFLQHRINYMVIFY